ncbi:MAG: DUF885 domain-containing protein, partial [Candidatus Binataceae bacterium]
TYRGGLGRINAKPKLATRRSSIAFVRGPQRLASHDMTGAFSRSGGWLAKRSGAVGITLAIAIVAVTVGPCGAETAKRAAPGDPAFRAEVARFIGEELRLFPERATYVGEHRYDGRVDDLTRGGIAAIVAHAKRWRRTFTALDAKSLSAPNEADREWLLARLDGYLLWNEQLRSYETDPSMYLPTSGVYSLVIRDFAPLEKRMQLVTARAKASLAKLEAARVNLIAKRTAKISVEIALAELDGSLRFLRTDLPKLFDSIAEGPEKREFAAANRNLIAQTRAYEHWLRTDLLATASGNYAIGADAYRRMLRDSDLVDTPLEELERVGARELGRLHKRMVETAAKIDPGKTPAEVIEAVTANPPPAGKVLPTVAAGLAKLRDYVRAKKIATIPSEVLPIVRETPPFRRATTFASMSTPGPFEKATEAYFYVTLPDPSWPPQRQGQLLRFYAPPTISDTSVHEAYPGHYVQFLNNRLNPDLVRALYSSGANAEGWALYCEEMMLDEGLHDGDPRYRLVQIQMALMRAVRYLVGLHMHTGGMTVDEAAALFEKRAYMTPNNARMEALRGTQDPGYLRYQLGKLMILKLREDVRSREGPSFELGRFHDRFLREGALPIKLIRRAMLGSDGPLL